MKTKILLFLICLFCVSFSGCASYISKFHKNFEKEDMRKMNRAKQDQFQRYRQNNMRLHSRGLGPSTARKRKRDISFEDRRYNKVFPDRKRKRYTARDLQDNGHDGSLWSSLNGTDNYLFTNNDIKQVGDIVLLNVLTGFKNKISLELRRMFPAPEMPITAKKEEKIDAKAPKGPAPASAKKTEVKKGDVEIYDKISCILVEEINRDHVILRGKKEVIFRNKKHLIEVQGLLPKRHINPDNVVQSDKMLESSVKILY